MLEVREVEPRQLMFLIDGMESSYLDLDHPEHLEFEYMQHMDAALRAVFPAAAPVRALHLGAGACALARAWDATRPGSAQLAIEWDSEIARVVREWFPLPRSPQLRIRTGDARVALDGFPTHRWDVVVRDAFVRGQVPEHLADDGAWQTMRRVLAPGGLALANVADSAPLTGVRAEVGRALRAFGNAILIADPAVLKGRRYGNLVIAASATPLDDAAVSRSVHGLPMPARILTGEELLAFAA